MKTVTLPLNIVSSSLAGVHADSHEHTSWERMEACRFISALTVRLQGALRLHQFTQQRSTARSPPLHSPHVSPLHGNNKAVRVTAIVAQCYCTIRSMCEVKSQVEQVQYVY